MNYENFKVSNPITSIPRLNFNKVTMFYVGKDHCCRCGCGGKYYHNSSEKSWKAALTVFNKLLTNGCIREVLVEENSMERWINIAYGDKHQNRCYCFYFDK